MILVKIFDAHCDVLYKMFMNPNISSFAESTSLHVTLGGMKTSNVKVQCFAIYVPESVHPDVTFRAALHMVDLFYEKILRPHPEIRLIKSRADLKELQSDQMGAILTLEGCDSIGTDLMKLKTLLRLGVTSVGLTWNYANGVADGALEERGAGLSKFGHKVVQLLNETGTWCDVSHLSEKGFWDCMEQAEYPFASHSNVYSLCPHPRNLRDEQIMALIERDTCMGLTFVPAFLSGRESANMTDILRHLDYVCALGGENHVGFGSDFDGIDETVEGLGCVGEYAQLVNELAKYYSAQQVERFLYENMAKRFPSKQFLALG